MGGVLQKMMGGDGAALPEVDINFSGVTPSSPEEEAIYNEIAQVISRCETALEKIEHYQNCAELCRKAISKSTPTAEDEAWEAVVSRVEEMKFYYDVSRDLDAAVPKFLSRLSGASPIDNLTKNQAIAKQFVELLNFALRFDEQKMMNPHLQNDFAYYKRNLSKAKTKAVTGSVREEDANRISLFLANATPMMQTLIDATTKVANADPNIPNLLSILANVCLSVVVHEKCGDENTKMLCLRAMTGSAVLFDHIDPQGVFRKNSPVVIKRAIQVLKAQRPSPDILLNALRFSSKHFKDPSTPKPIKDLLV
eukprot:TRINITY_DN7900_c0_g1::TRINITY_DN7900_c0_g1_i1::g.23690::m.23690 TRINITY_DN7900_c0_g1::TRINITY_DN7900_c0_g1_i1::g.23690  ORF type:complete len:309 (-),score=54.51,sp/Q8T2H0/FAM49_DICDI/40.82/6e-73,DUF1394/PF07159.7/1.8e-80 TRINITY_DN7900_c0_g1_i1:188-1114(-)